MGLHPAFGGSPMLTRVFVPEHLGQYLVAGGANWQCIEKNGRGERIRTSDPLVPNQVRYQTALRPERAAKSHSRCQVPEAAPEWMPVCGRQSAGHGRRAGLQYRLQQFSRDSMWRVRHCRDTWAAALPLGMRGRYTERDDESPPELRVLLPNDLGRPLSTLVDSCLLLPRTS